VTFFQPTEDNADSPFYTKKYLYSQIMVALGGRVAEEIIYGPTSITTGATSDYAMVYQIAREMVTVYGFGQNNFDYRNLSPEAAMKIDTEIDGIVTRCYEGTKNLLETRRDELERLKDLLIEEEIIDGERVYDLLGVLNCTEFDCIVNFD